MKSLDILLTDSNTERSQYTHSELRTKCAIHRASKRDSKRELKRL
jgi:hypothetical protein